MKRILIWESYPYLTETTHQTETTNFLFFLKFPFPPETTRTHMRRTLIWESYSYLTETTHQTEKTIFFFLVFFLFFFKFFFPPWNDSNSYQTQMTKKKSNLFVFLPQRRLILLWDLYSFSTETTHQTETTPVFIFLFLFFPPLSDDSYTHSTETSHLEIETTNFFFSPSHSRFF